MCLEGSGAVRVRKMGLLRGFIQNRNDTVTFWIAVASFILSVATFVLSNLINPDVEMEVARFVRVGHVQPNGSAYLTIQPTVVSFGRSTRVEVLRNFVVEVAPK